MVDTAIDQNYPVFNIQSLINKTNSDIYHQDTSFSFKTIISPEEGVSKRAKQIKKFREAFSPRENSALASIIASVIGDAMGAHTEFSEFDPSRKFFKVGLEDLMGMNNLRCKIGQWTDDSSMGLCVADSLIEKRRVFDGVDLRTRFLYWWHEGYNNGLKGDSSFGLGGNIFESFMTFYADPTQPKTEVIFFRGTISWDCSGSQYRSKGQNNGNGSLMRLAPIPIAFLDDLEGGMNYAREQSFCTHDGQEAAECCRLLCFLVISLINRPKGSDFKKAFERLGDEFKTESNTVKALARSESENYLLYPTSWNKVDADRDWNWRSEDLYNYSPTRLNQNKSYIGSYCMDALAMALNVTYNSKGVLEDVIRAVNLGGDSDSVGAIVGMISGAIHGLDESLVENYTEFVTKWDDYTIAARALKLIVGVENVCL